MARKFLEIAFTPAVLEAQQRYFGRSRPVSGAADFDALGVDEFAFITERDSFYMASVSETGWPYVQHRGGPAGFLRRVDERTLGFADYSGNRQMISVGNLAMNARVCLFLMDYPNRVRLKILGRARVEDARERPDLVRQLADPGMEDRVERIVLIEVVSFDWNCPKYITPRFTEEQIHAAIQPLHDEIAALRARVAQLQGSALPRE